MEDVLSIRQRLLCGTSVSRLLGYAYINSQIITAAFRDRHLPAQGYLCIGLRLEYRHIARAEPNSTRLERLNV